MITIIVGQRGVGKTSLLNRIQKYSTDQTSMTFDLDQYIEKKENQTIQSIFKSKGETHFRELEKKHFFSLIQDCELKQSSEPKLHFYISVGGGFNIDLIPNHIRILWIQRISDHWGRIFLNRPRLNPELHPITEFKSRALQRSENFKCNYWDEYLIPEGLNTLSQFENQIVQNTLDDVKGILTLLPSILKDKKGLQNIRFNPKWKYFLTKHKNWKLDFIEVRDDLILEQQRDYIFNDLHDFGYSIIYSLRNGKETFPEENLQKIFQKKYLVDCDIHLLQNYKHHKIHIVSCHERHNNETFTELLKKISSLNDVGYHIKLAVPINNFTELLQGHIWQQQMPLKRSFLPRSENGKWSWYRLYMKGRMSLQFIKEGIEGSALDQPSLYQWISVQSPVQKFAAILGSPVQHSFTPVEQSPFFAPHPVFAIDCQEAEFNEAMGVLEKLGLMAAAITSPLKIKAHDFVKSKSLTAIEFSSVNTIFKNTKKEQHWLGHNTDLDGLKKLFEPLQKLSTDRVIAIWGGGGTLPLIQKLLPNAISFSVRTQTPRNEVLLKLFQKEKFSPHVVIWAAPNSKTITDEKPWPDHWKPELIIDLNYKEESDGLWFAQSVDCKYISGLEMFYEQAQKQRDFFSDPDSLAHND